MRSRRQRYMKAYIFKDYLATICWGIFQAPPSYIARETDEFRFCCLARSVSCLPPPDEFSSCEDLMSNLMLRLCVWLLAGVAIVGNLLVIVWRTRYSRCNQVPGPAAAISAGTSVSSTRHLVIGRSFIWCSTGYPVTIAFHHIICVRLELHFALWNMLIGNPKYLLSELVASVSGLCSASVPRYFYSDLFTLYS